VPLFFVYKNDNNNGKIIKTYLAPLIEAIEENKKNGNKPI
jgi:hypothetical protein